MGPTRQFCLVNCQGKLVRVGLVLGSPMALKVGPKKDKKLLRVETGCRKRERGTAVKSAAEADSD